MTVQGTLYYDEQYDHCLAPRNSTPKDQRVEAVSAICPINISRRTMNGSWSHGRDDVLSTANESMKEEYGVRLTLVLAHTRH